MTSESPRPRVLQPGEPAPWFRGKILGGRPDWAFNAAGGRICLMLFMGSAAAPEVVAALDTVVRQRALFDDVQASFFGVSVDPDDVNKNRIEEMLPGIRHFIDKDLAISRAYGAIEGITGGQVKYQPHFLLLDRTLRTIMVFPVKLANAALDAVATAIADPGQSWAPVIEVPRILEPELCERLVQLYDINGGAPSGFMREIDGKTQLVVDPAFKRRSDCDIDDAALRQALMTRIQRRLVPAIKRAFQFEATRIERYIVACYDAADGGAFSAHRDNTTRGTAHRRFAVTINLNHDYDGGELRFPEYGDRTYRAPVGGAVVFSCSLLHEATPVTRGRRYATLPFLYDDAAAKVREANNAYLGDTVIPYDRDAGRVGGGPV